MTLKVWEWRRSIAQAELASTTKLVLHSLSVYMSEDGDRCFPTIEQLAKDSNLSTRVVILHLQKAIDSGFIQRFSNRRHGKNWRNYSYQACLPKAAIYDTENDKMLVQKLVQMTTQGGATSAHAGDFHVDADNFHDSCW